VIRQICQAREVTIVRGLVSPDHIHLLVSLPFCPRRLVQYVKGKSIRQLQEDYPHLRKRCWGQRMWARGYFCATVGVVDEKMIMEYIKNQKWDEDADSFKITELPSLKTQSDFQS
jgi:putative transposase